MRDKDNQNSFDRQYGWIKLPRTLMNWEWYDNSEMVHLFVHLLLKANHETGIWRGIEIERGSLISSRGSLSKILGISEQSVRTCLKRLKSTKEITITSTNKYTIITLCNYNTYQANDNKINQQNNPNPNKQLTNHQPATNHKQEYTKKREEGGEKLSPELAFSEFKKEVTSNRFLEETNTALNFDKDHFTRFTIEWIAKKGLSKDYDYPKSKLIQFLLDDFQKVQVKPTSQNTNKLNPYEISKKNLQPV